MSRPNDLKIELEAMFQRRQEDMDTFNVVPGRVRRRIKMLRLTYAGIGLVVLIGAGVTAATLRSGWGAAPGEDPLAPAAPGQEGVAQEVDGEAPVEEELVGTWTGTGESAAVRFRRNGTVQLADSLLGLRSPSASGTYSLEGNRVTFMGGCLEGQLWEVGLILGYNPYEDALDVSFVEAGCGFEPGTFWELQRVKT